MSKDPPFDETFEDVDARADAEIPLQAPHLFLILECERPAAGSARYSLEGIDEVVVGRRARLALGGTGRAGVRWCPGGTADTAKAWRPAGHSGRAGGTGAREALAGGA